MGNEIVIQRRDLFNLLVVVVVAAACGFFAYRAGQQQGNNDFRIEPDYPPVAPSQPSRPCPGPYCPNNGCRRQPPVFPPRLNEGQLPPAVAK